MATAFAVPALPGAQAAGEWEWSVEPYFMATNIDGDIGTGRFLEGPIEVDTSDILETLELGGMIHLEAIHSSGWGGIADYGFMRLGDKLTGPRDGVNKLTVRQGVFEGMAFRRFAAEKGFFDVYGGIRWWDNKVRLQLALDLPQGQPEVTIKEAWIDPVIGVRYYAQLNDKWTLSLQGDIGGFGMGADFTYAVVGGFLYRFNDTFSLDVRYKALWVDYVDGQRSSSDYFKYDTVTHGLIVGLVIEL